MDEAKYRNNMNNNSLTNPQYIAVDGASMEQNYGGPRRNYQDQYGYQQQSRHMVPIIQSQYQPNAPRMYGDSGRQGSQPQYRSGRDIRDSGDHSSYRDDHERKSSDREPKDLRRGDYPDRKVKRERSDSGRDDRKRDR